MGISRASLRRASIRGPIAAAAGMALLLLGCAHAKAPSAAPRPGAAPAPSSSTPAPAREPGRGVVAPGTLDPSEEITPGELASIPEPVPRDQPSRSGLPPPSSTVPSPPPSRSQATNWRVQIYASENRAEAERVAQDASSRLRAEASVDFEPPLYKVRLGGYATEGEAQALRERAIQAGYAGAFRTQAGAR